MLANLRSFNRMRTLVPFITIQSGENGILQLCVSSIANFEIAVRMACGPLIMIPSQTNQNQVVSSTISSGTLPGFLISTANYTARTALHNYVRSPSRTPPCTICQSPANGVIGQNGARVMFPAALG